MVEKGIDRGFSAVDQMHYAFWQSSFFEEFVNVAHGKRDALGWLEDKCVASRDGVGQIPERNHAGKVEGHDGGGDADGLADHHLIDAARHIFEVVALHHHGNATGDFDVFDCASHLGFGFGEGLAVFLRDDAGNVVEVIFEQHLQLEQWLDAVFGAACGAIREGCGRGFDSLVDFVGLREWDLSQSFAVAGLTTSRPFLRTGVGPLAVDVVG